MCLIFPKSPSIYFRIKEHKLKQPTKKTNPDHAQYSELRVTEGTVSPSRQTIHSLGPTFSSPLAHRVPHTQSNSFFVPFPVAEKATLLTGVLCVCHLKCFSDLLHFSLFNWLLLFISQWAVSISYQGSISVVQLKAVVLPTL